MDTVFDKAFPTGNEQGLTKQRDYIYVRCDLEVPVILLISVKYINTKHLFLCLLSRFLKQVLQYVQNLTTYTSAEKNRWDEVVALSLSFSQHIHQTLKQNFMLKNIPSLTTMTLKD
jgi:hypothetical protein